MRSADYVVETTTSIAGTLGNGAITLAAVTSRPRVSSVLTATTTARYVIEDTINKKMEIGIGDFVSNVLTRSKVLATWDGTTYVNTGTVSPLQFGSTPTSGNVLIRLAATAEAMGAVMDGRNTTVTGDSNWRDYPFSSHYQSTGGPGVGSNMVAGNEYYSCYKLENSGILSGFQLQVTTAVAASNLKLALFDFGSNGLPNRKIVDFVSQTPVTTGIKTDTAIVSWTPSNSIFLTNTWYAIGSIADSAIALGGCSIGTNTVGATPFGRKNAYGYGNTVYVAGNFTTGLPVIANLTGGSMADPATATHLSAPFFGLKIT